MTLPDLAAVASSWVALAQESSQISGFSAESAAARPEVVARGFRFLIGAYTAVWVILAAYLLSLSVRLRRLSLQVRRLKDRTGL